MKSLNSLGSTFLLSFLLVFVFHFKIKAQEKHFYAEQVDTIFQNLNKSFVTTGILYDRAFPLSRFDFFNPGTDTATFKFASQAYYELYQAHYNRTGLLDPVQMMNMVEWENLRNRVPILILDYNYNKLDTMALDDNLLSYQNGYLYDVPGRPRSPYWQQRFQLATPLMEEVKSNNVTFLVIPHFISRNTSLHVQSVIADFGDGSGQHTLYGTFDSVTVNYTNAGEKIVYIQVNFTNGSFFQTKSKINIGINNYNARTTAPPYDPCFQQQVTASILYQGIDETNSFYGKFVANYYYRTNDGTLCDGTNKLVKKPIVLIDGYDPTDKRDAAALYENFLFYMDDVNFPSNPAKEFIIPELRSQGYDIIIVDIPTYFHVYSGPIIPLPPNADNPPPGYSYNMGKIIRGGGDYVQRNAFALIQLINDLNAELASQSLTEQLVIIGPSMGGQISRYALRWMELNNQNHNCRLWVSFDSNHEGSVIPIGQQYFLDFLAGGDITAAIKGRDRQINSAAAKQFLIDHYLYHKATGSISPGSAPGYFNNFYDELNSMGWPQNCRKIALVSGAENGSSPNTLQGGDLAYQHVLKLNKRSGLFLAYFGAILAALSEVELLDAKIFLAPTPSQSVGLVFEAKVKLLIHIFQGLSSTKNYGTASSLMANKSLETVQGGFYWGFKELAESSGGNNSVVQNTARTIRQFITYPFGYHSHHLTIGDLALHHGPIVPNSNRKMDDDISNINVACGTEKESPFDAYYGPTTFNVKHDSLFYWQAKYLIGEICIPGNCTSIPNKTITQTIINNSTGPWCNTIRRTFQILNPKPGQTFTWGTSHSGLVIRSGQGTSSVEVEYTGGAISSSAYISCQSTHSCYAISINNFPLNIIFGLPFIAGTYFTNGQQQPLHIWFGNPSTDYNNVCTLESVNTNMQITGASSVTWTKLTSNPSNISWSQNGNNLNFYLWNTGQTALFRIQALNGCGTSSYDFGFKSITCSGGGGGGCYRYQVSPNPATSSVKVIVPNIPPPCKIASSGSSNGTMKRIITEIKIYDQLGNLRKVQREKNKTKQTAINLRGLISGMYVLEISDGDYKERHQLIILR